MQPSPVNGLKTVLTDSGVLYASERQAYPAGPAVRRQRQRAGQRDQPTAGQQDGRAERSDDRLQGAEEKHVITVFTDITCGYCHKLHQQMKEYNDLGITVRYLAFPRQGLASQAEKRHAVDLVHRRQAKAFDAAMKNDAFLRRPAKPTSASITSWACSSAFRARRRSSWKTA